MDITYTTKGEVRVAGKGLSVSFDPPAEVKADVLLLSQPSTGARTLTTFDGPGEYEVKGCMIDGIALATGQTAYRIELEDMKLGYLPVFPEEGDKSFDALAGVAVLFVSLGGASAEAAAKLVAALEPRVVAPINYAEAELKAFLAELGAKDIEPIGRLKIQSKDIAEDKQEVVVLKPQ